MISKIKKPVSILLALMMVVSLFAIVPMTASAADYVDSNVRLGDLAAGDTLSANNGELYFDCQEYSVIIKGDTYKEKLGFEPQADDIEFQDGQYAMYISRGGNGPLLTVFTATSGDKYYYPLDAEGNPSDKWYVLSNENNTVTLAGHVPAEYYVVGTMNSWSISEDYKMALNENNTSEYWIQNVPLHSGDEIKVVSSTDGSTVQYWYPDGTDNNLVIGEDGYYNVYVAPAGHNTWHYNCILATKQSDLNYVAQIGDNKYETLEAAFAAAADGDTITLLANCAGNGIKAPQGKFATGLTVDFAGHTYTVDGETVGSTGTETNGFQLLKDNKITFENGTITSTKAKILVQNYSDLTLYGMTLTLNNDNYTSAYTLSNNNGDVVINNTTIKANPAGGFAFDVCRFSSYPSVNVTVKGNSQIYGDVEISASKGDAKEGFSLKLEGGDMSGDIVVDASAKALVGETNKVTKADDFTQTAPADFEWVDNGDGTSSLKAIEYVAQIGTAKYRTLEDAFAAAADGNTITLLADCTGNGIKAPQGKFATNGLTVDFAGHTYTVDGETVGSSGTETQAFQLLKNNKITFKGGTITSTTALMLVQNYSDLTLKDMTLDGSNLVGNNRYTLSNNNGNVVIDGSTITAKAGEGNYAFDVCRYSSYPSVNVTVTGNSQINGDVEISASGNNAKDGFSLKLESGKLNGDIVLDPSAKAAMAAAPDKAVVSKAADFEQDAPADYKWDSTGKLVPCEYVAQVNGVNYETLEAAFAAAQDGNTITLLANCAGNGIKVAQGKYPNGLTVDFGGYTYTVDGTTVGSTGTETNGFQLLKDNKITFRNGTITSTKAKILVQNYSDLTLDGMTLTLNNTGYNGAYTLSNNNGDVVINNTTINANPTTGSFAFDVCRFSSYPSVNVTVTGNSTINGSVEVSASNSAAKDGFSLTLESGTMTGNIVVADSAKNLINNGGTVNKADAFTKAAPEGFVWVDSATTGVQTLAKAVAKIGTTNYATLEAAFAAAQDGDTITLLADCAGNGIKAPQGKFATGLTVDFDGHTYIVDGETVGSTGTETNGFQLLKDNKITFKNGTITSTKAKILVQNYSDLTLDKMTLTLNNAGYTSAYTLSNNNGNVVINDTTIKANPAGGFAFDVCRFSSYPSVNVTVKGNSQINGDVEISASGSNAKDGFSLNLNGGTMTGAIVLDQTAKNAMENYPDKVSVNKATTFDKAAPEGYKWVDKDGKQTLAKIVKLFDSHSVTLGGDIGVNFYINPAAAGADEHAAVSVDFSWNGQTRTVDAKYDDGKKLFKATCDVVAAEVACDITAVATVNDVVQTQTDTYSVQRYAEAVYNNPAEYDTKGRPDELKALAKALLNYGAMAQTVFVEYMKEPVKDPADIVKTVEKTDFTDISADDIAGEATNLEAIADQLGFKYYTSSVLYLQNNTLRLYFTPKTYPGEMPHKGDFKGNQSNYYYYVEKEKIAAAELDDQQTFTIGDKNFTFSALDYAKAVVNSSMGGDQKDLAKSLYLYNQAANAYFD